MPSSGGRSFPIPFRKKDPRPPTRRAPVTSIAAHNQLPTKIAQVHLLSTCLLFFCFFAYGANYSVHLFHSFAAEHDSQLLDFDAAHIHCELASLPISFVLGSRRAAITFFCMLGQLGWTGDASPQCNLQDVKLSEAPIRHSEFTREQIEATCFGSAWLLLPQLWTYLSLLAGSCCCMIYTAPHAFHTRKHFLACGSTA